MLDGMEIHRVGGRYTFSLHAPRYFRHHLLASLPDVVVEDLNKIPLFTPWWSRVPVVPLVHHLFGATAFREAALPVAATTWLMERPLPIAFRGLPVVAVSHSTRDDLIRRGLRADDIQVVPNGVDICRYAPAPHTPRFDEPTILYLGRLKRYKSIDLILRAVAQLRDQGRHLRFLVGGKGDDRARLEALVTTLQIDDRVEFLGYVSDERKLDLFRRAWIHVITSPKEGWGITNLEAAACGTPSVASDSPGLRESVIDLQTGLLVPHGDIDALVAALTRLLDDPELRARLGAAGVEFARGFSWEVATSRIEAILKRRVAADSGRP